MPLEVSRRILVLCSLAFATSAGAQSGQEPKLSFDQIYQTAVAKAQSNCAALWSDHTFDPYRTKLQFGGDKPTLSMLTNTERMQPKERPVAELAMKVLEQCRKGWSPVYSMLPPPVVAMIQGSERKEDTLIAELIRGKITFGEFNIGLNKLNAEILGALSGVPASQPAAKSAERQSTTPITSVATQERAAPIPKEIRLALVIGNSKYANLPKLPNPTNDAQSIAAVFKKMGYSTQLLLDASDQSVRREVRKFANTTGGADVAVIFYAGHGAQVGGSNYVLPVDMDIPNIESDISLSGLKVDDLTNSIRSKVKILFLDACRDNPLLYKNIVTGRGSITHGLAPTNLDQSKSGNNVFIAYSTDAGAVADDGKGQHSPFTEALLKNLQKPISIDEMFSIVTREVREATNNAQRPYKYVSMEKSICLASSCFNDQRPTANIKEANLGTGGEVDKVIQSKSIDSIEAYLKNNPSTPRRSDLLDEIGNLKRSEFAEWTLYEIGDLHNPNFMQIGTIQQYGTRAAAKTRGLVDPKKPKIFFGKTLPDAVSFDDVTVYDCSGGYMATAEETLRNASGDVLFHYKWADPQYINFSNGVKLTPGSVGETARNFVCNEDLRTPLVSKDEMKKMKFASLSSTVNGEGEIFYGAVEESKNNPDQKEVVVVLKLNMDHSVKDFFTPGTEIQNPPDYRVEVDRLLMKCSHAEYAIAKTEFWNSANEIVQIKAIDRSRSFSYSNFVPTSPFAILQNIVCQKSYAGLGLLFDLDNGSIKVTKIFDGSPAERFGLKTNDVITHINNESIQGMTTDKVAEKIRGPADTKVTLTIARAGESKPLEVTAIREFVSLATQGNMGTK